MIGESKKELKKADSGNGSGPLFTRLRFPLVKERASSSQPGRPGLCCESPEFGETGPSPCCLYSGSTVRVTPVSEVWSLRPHVGALFKLPPSYGAPEPWC